MKRLSIILFIGLFLVTHVACGAQKIMQTLKDAQHLKQNEHLFLGKPLKELLKEITPKIKMITVETETSNFLMLHFYDFEDRQSLNNESIIPLRITVYLKEKIDWDKSYLPIGIERIKWTEKDAERLGNLIVTHIKVSGVIIQLATHENCLANKRYNIFGMGGENEVLPISMNIEIIKDSIIFLAGENQKDYFLFFRILESLCSWKDSILISVSFKLLLKEGSDEKKPIMNLVLKDNKPDFFDLLYPDSEIRRFHIRNEY